MTEMKKVLALFAIIAVFAMNSAFADTSDVPAWVDHDFSEFEESYPDYVFGVGSTKGPAETSDFDHAAYRAIFEIWLAVYKASVDSSDDYGSEQMLTYYPSSYSVDYNISIQNAMVLDIWESPEGETYVLMGCNLPEEKEQMQRFLQAESARQQVYDELMLNLETK